MQSGALGYCSLAQVAQSALWLVKYLLNLVPRLSVKVSQAYHLRLPLIEQGDVVFKPFHVALKRVEFARCFKVHTVKYNFSFPFLLFSGIYKHKEFADVADCR